MTASTEPAKIDLPPVTRPNGKTYRPRQIVAHGWDNDDYGDGCGAIILGTHDVARARRLAESACSDWHGSRYAISPVVGWFRDGFRDGRRSWITDEVRGAAGVMFTASDEPEGS